MGPGLSDVQCESDIERMYDSRRGAEDIASVAALAQVMSTCTDSCDQSPRGEKNRPALITIITYYYYSELPLQQLLY